MGFVHCVLTATVCYFVCRGVCVGGCLRRKEEWGSGVRSCVCVCGGGGVCEEGMGVYASPHVYDWVCGCA